MHVKQSAHPRSTADFGCGASSWPIKSHARDEGRGFAPSFWLVVLVACLLNAAGCGGSSGGKSAGSPTPTATATPAVQEGAIFAPVFPPLSPNTVGYAPSSKQAVSSAGVQLAAAAVAPVALNHYFYLVNGSGMPTPGPNGVRPNPSSTPSVLTVNGPSPNGAPQPERRDRGRSRGFESRRHRPSALESSGGVQWLFFPAQCGELSDGARPANHNR